MERAELEGPADDPGTRFQQGWKHVDRVELGAAVDEVADARGGAPDPHVVGCSSGHRGVVCLTQALHLLGRNQAGQYDESVLV